MHTNASNAIVGCIHGKQGKPCLSCSCDQKRLSRAQETGGDLYWWNNFHNMSSVLKVERQAYNNEEMWKNLGIPNFRMQKITADFPQQLCDQIAQLECVVSPRYNPSIWLLGCDRKEEIRTQHPRTSQLLYPCCVADIFSHLPVQTGRLENVFQERPLLQSFTNLLLQIKRLPPQTS
jgi:hypothetical protein